MDLTATMHDLAPELLEQIFTLACTDGGYTGCSLSLVSKYVGAASRSGRFHSVSITSGTAQQLSKFQYCFNRACTAAREDGGRTPLVRHLCMSTLCRDTTERQQQHMTNIFAFLRSVSTKLYTLSLLYPTGRTFSESMPPHIECPSFPLLQELTIIGPDPFIPERTDCTLPLYPQVTRLHLIDVHGTIEELPHWESMADWLLVLPISAFRAFSKYPRSCKPSSNLKDVVNSPTSHVS